MLFGGVSMNPKVFQFYAKQITPNSLRYSANKIIKVKDKDTGEVIPTVVSTEGVIRTTKVRYFNFLELHTFAERCAKHTLFPDEGPKKEIGKGMHQGSCFGSIRKSRAKRKTHAERRAAIVARSK